MKLKAIKPVNNCINKFMREWGLTAEIGTDFSYLYEKRVVVWTPIVSSQNDIDFRNFFESLGCNVKCDVFLYSLLHEIGHSQTLDDIDDEDYAYSLDRKAQPISNYEYFRLPDEIVATQWAVDYLNDENNMKKLRLFWEEFVPKMMNFYKKNNIEILED